MIKFVMCITRHPDMSRSDFKDYWMNIHGPFFMKNSGAMGKIIKGTNLFSLAINKSVPFFAYVLLKTVAQAAHTYPQSHQTGHQDSYSCEPWIKL